MSKEPRKKKLIGEELVKSGLLTPEQLKLVLEEQSQLKDDSKERLGDIIIRRQLVDQEKMIYFLEKYLGIPYMKLKGKGYLDPNAISMVPERMARNFKLIALKAIGDKLQVAMSNPLDVIALDTIKARTGMQIERFFSLPQEVEGAINKFYQGEAIEKSISDFITLKEEEEKKSGKASGISLDSRQLESEASKAPVVRFVNRLLENSVRERASDIHIEPQEKELFIRYRVDGLLREFPPPPKAMESAITTRIKLLGGMDIAERRLPQDGRFKFAVKGKDIDVRLASTPVIFGEKLVMRLLDKTKLSVDMEELGLTKPEMKIFKHALDQPHGLILVSGPTGSGKSTTLYSALKYLNQPEKNIVTIEDPVEYELKGINQIQIKPAIGLTFASSLRTILRQDPDIIMIGEIRDIETLENCVKAALTGHLVLSTIHTNDAVSVVFRLMHMGLEPYLITACLNLTVAQRLIRRICPNCREKVKLSAVALKGLEERTGTSLKNITFYAGKGCKECDNLGYKGRIGIYELFGLNDETKKMILDGASEADLKKAAVKFGMKNLFLTGLEKVTAGFTTIEEVLKVSFIEKDL